MEALLMQVAGKIAAALLVEEPAKIACSHLGSERSLLTGIKGSTRRVKRAFEQIKAFLDEVDARRNKKPMEAWLKEVRKIAHDMEDAIDEYTYLTARQSASKSIDINCIKKATTSRAWHQLAAMLKQIEEDVAHVFVTMRQAFDIKESDDEEGSNSNHVVLSHGMEDDQIIGMQKEKETLVGWMRDEVPQHFIITVWGMGGLGKTTLVKHAYKSMEIERCFDLKGWVSVSQSYQHTDLLRRIYKSLISDSKRAESELRQKDSQIEGLDFATLVESTQTMLSDSRFLIILDDVWDPNAYFKLEHAFRGCKLGSKIVITTRIREVASLANEQCQMEHRKLDPNERWDLFCNMAFWKDVNRRCPQELEEWGRKIVDKCDGLPLAIVAVARLISLKRQSEWKHVYDRLTWEFTNNPALDSVKHILNLSYYDLPSYLKNCFLYCSIFPEDYRIGRKRLIKLWVAEGFVQPRGAQTMEDVAKDYFNELIHRCMLQVIDWSSLENVRYCRMHDLLRELTLEVARNENFSTVVAKSQVSSSVAEARRLSIHGSLRRSMDLSRIRSLIVFDDAESLMSMLSSKTKYLRVLDLQHANLTKVPNTVGDLFNLHYLSLRDTKISQLPNSIGRLRNLQTLDLCGTNLQSLPKGTTKLRNLRHLAMDVYLPAPRGLWNLTCLQQLQVEADEELVRRLKSLTSLRKLGISQVKGSYWPHLIPSTSMMTFLSKLTIFAVSREELFPLKEFGHVLRNLLKLNLKFRLSNADFPSLVDFLGDKIRELRLRSTGLRDDPLSELSRLSNLVRLDLIDAYDGERLCFGFGWFPKLIVLRLFELPNLSEIALEKGSMERLQKLYLATLPDLKQVPQGIEFQKSIRFLLLKRCNPLLSQMMKGEQKYEVSHIPNIWNFECRDDKWSKEVIR